MLELTNEASELGVRAAGWSHGQKLISRARDLAPDEKEYFYSVNKYVRMAHEDYKEWVLEVDQCPPMKGQWRRQLKLEEGAPLDLEIGTGNGYFFEHRARSYQERGLVGIELKYKPLIQTVKRTLFTGHRQFRVLRYDAKFIMDLFAEGEISDVFIFFPDPWEKRRENKHRLINEDFLKKLHSLQRPGSRLKFKTDSESYYHWVKQRVPTSPYELLAETNDLHNSQWASENFQTHFEKLWTRKGRKTHYLSLQRN